MADPNHVALVYKGTEAIEKWKKDNPTEILNLEKARLHGIWLFQADLSEANLEGAIFERANLARANLRGCNLNNANFSDAVLTEAKLAKVYGPKARFMNANLMGANLKESNLSGSDFFGANMFKSDLSQVNFSGSRMTLSDMALAKLIETNLSKADLQGAHFFATEMTKTNLQNTNLLGAMFSGTEFNQVHINGSKIGQTIFVKVDFTEILGIEQIYHSKPSFVDYSTISITFYKNDNKFSEKFENFLVDTGIPHELVKELPRILSARKYCDAFVCYGKPDEKFAEKLVKDLRNRGVPCWLYSLDSTVGKRTWEEIQIQRQKAEKMIVLCSAQSLIRNGVLKEIEEQIDENPNKIIPISLDNIWKEENFRVMRASNNLKPFLLDKNYADFSHPANYDKTLIRLLKGLERTEKSC